MCMILIFDTYEKKKQKWQDVFLKIKVTDMLTVSTTLEYNKFIFNIFFSNNSQLLKYRIKIKKCSHLKTLSEYCFMLNKKSQTVLKIKFYYYHPLIPI